MPITSLDSPLLPPQMMYEKESRIVMDYSLLSETHKELDDSDDVHKAEKRMNKHINDLMNTIQRIQVSGAPLLLLIGAFSFVLLLDCLLTAFKLKISHLFQLLDSF